MNENRTKWETVFFEQQSLWKEFSLKAKRMEEWIIFGQKICSEKNDNLGVLIDKHTVITLKYFKSLYITQIN